MIPQTTPNTLLSSFPALFCNSHMTNWCISAIFKFSWYRENTLENFDYVIITWPVISGKNPYFSEILETIRNTMQKTVCPYLVPVLRNPWQKLFRQKKTNPSHKEMGLWNYWHARTAHHSQPSTSSSNGWKWSVFTVDAKVVDSLTRVVHGFGDFFLELLLEFAWVGDLNKT